MTTLESKIAALAERARVKACLGDSDELRDAFYEMDSAYQAERLLREAVESELNPDKPRSGDWGIDGLGADVIARYKRAQAAALVEVE